MEEQKLLFFLVRELVYGPRPQLAKFAVFILRDFLDGYLYLWSVICGYLDPKLSFKMVLLYIPPLVSTRELFIHKLRERPQESHCYL